MRQPDKRTDEQRKPENWDKWRAKYTQNEQIFLESLARYIASLPEPSEPGRFQVRIQDLKTNPGGLCYLDHEPWVYDC